MNPPAVQALDAPPALDEPVTIALVDGTVTFSQRLQDRAEIAFTLPTPAGESPVFYLVRNGSVPYWYIHFHGVDALSASNNVQVGFTRVWYVLNRLGVRDVISAAAVGAVNSAAAGDVFIPDDFIDFSTHRPRSILTEIWERPPWTFVGFEPAMCSDLRAILNGIAKQKLTCQVFERGTYGQFEGHRFESPAEIRMANILQADMVGHHQASEAIYARELGIHYGALAFVTNAAAGLATDSAKAFLPEGQSELGFAACTEVLLEAIVQATRRQVECQVCSAAKNSPAWKRSESVLARPVFR